MCRLVTANREKKYHVPVDGIGELEFHDLEKTAAAWR
jgi:hypothetical protein